MASPAGTHHLRSHHARRRGVADDLQAPRDRHQQPLKGQVGHDVVLRERDQRQQELGPLLMSPSQVQHEVVLDVDLELLELFLQPQLDLGIEADDQLAVGPAVQEVTDLGDLVGEEASLRATDHQHLAVVGDLLDLDQIEFLDLFA